MHIKSYEADLMQFPEYRLLKSMLLYGPPVLIVLGTFGNVFSFIILRRRAMMKVSSYHYLASLAVADSMVLYVGLFRLWLGEITGTDFYDITDWLCKLTISFSYMASDLSVWLIIAVTVERYIVVCFPLKASTMINTSRAKKVICFLVFIMFSINLHFLWTVKVVERPVDGRNVTNCEAAPFHQPLINEIWPWVDACIYSFVPFTVILVLNILIIFEVIEARNHRLQMQNTPDHQTSRLRNGECLPGRTTCRRSCGPGEGTKLTIMLLTVSFTFLLTTLPMNVSLIVTAFWQQNSMRQIAQFKLAKTVAELLMYVNHSINFFLYCATGHKFRQQIIHMMSCKSESAYAPWTSLQTEDTRIQANVRNGHHTTSRQHVLLANAADDEAVLNIEAIPLKEL